MSVGKKNRKPLLYLLAVMVIAYGIWFVWSGRLAIVFFGQLILRWSKECVVRGLRMVKVVQRSSP